MFDPSMRVSHVIEIKTDHRVDYGAVVAINGCIVRGDSSLVLCWHGQWYAARTTIFDPREWSCTPTAYGFTLLRTNEPKAIRHADSPPHDATMYVLLKPGA